MHAILTLVYGCAHCINDLLCLFLCIMLVKLIHGLGGLTTRNSFHTVSRFGEVFVLRGILKIVATANHDFRSVTLAKHFRRVNHEVSRLGHRLDLVNAIVMVVRDYVCQLATTDLARVLIVIGTVLLHNLEATIRDPSVIRGSTTEFGSRIGAITHLGFHVDIVICCLLVNFLIT
jgi:hypothetical protein